MTSGASRAMRSRYLHAAVRALAALDVRWFYIGLALTLGIWSVVNFALGHESRLRSETYDWMVRHRFHTPVPDRDIVILDIDEKSLAQMSADYGRWPWPRDVLGAVLAELEAQGAQAVVFDILFSDPDKQNPMSDKAFAAVVAAGRASFFTVLRLNPDNDGKSRIAAEDLPGLIVPIDAHLAPARTLALVPPYFASAVASGRLGVHNVYPDHDGVIRRYRLWEDVDGWRIASMPQRLANAFGWPAQPHSDRLIQWMAKPLAFKTLSFSDVYLDSQRKSKTRSRDEFKGKIVLIGSTAASLFDVKGTPLAAIHPGVDVLATAIDNAKNRRFLGFLSDSTQLAITLALLVSMVWLSIRYSHEQMNFAFVIAPLVLLLVSYLSLNVGGTFIDLSASASVALLYFTVAKCYNIVLRQYRGGQGPFALALEAGKAYRLACLGVLLPRGGQAAAYETRLLNAIRKHAPQARVATDIRSEIPWLETGTQRFILATWATPEQDEAGRDAAHEEARQLALAMESEFGMGAAPASSFKEQAVEQGASADEIAKRMRHLIADTLRDI
jgi:CHASE2 domain-containing sensor protein